MKFATLLVAGFLLSINTVSAGSIYKCETDEGIVFSQTACAPDAVKIKGRKSQSSQQSNTQQPDAQQTSTTNQQPAAGIKDAAVFDTISAETADVIIERVGPPAARYSHNGTEHWLYPNYVDRSDGKPVCPEVLLENGRMFQITWLPRDVMNKSVKVARGMEGWKEPASIRAKNFPALGPDIRGDSKSKVTSRYGRPDAKKIFMGQEVWEYRQVPMAQGSPETVTLYVTFEGDTVVSSAGN